MVDNEVLCLVNKMLLDNLQLLPCHLYRHALCPGFVRTTNDTMISTVSKATPIRIEEISYCKSKIGKSKVDQYVCA